MPPTLPNRLSGAFFRASAELRYHTANLNKAIAILHHLIIPTGETAEKEAAILLGVENFLETAGATNRFQRIAAVQRQVRREIKRIRSASLLVSQTVRLMRSIAEARTKSYRQKRPPRSSFRRFFSVLRKISNS